MSLLEETFNPGQIAALRSLIAATNASTAEAEAQAQRLAAMDADDLAAMDDPDDPAAPLWLLGSLTEWRSSYFVDWKDVESFVQSVQALAAGWGGRVSFGVVDPLDEAFLDDASVESLMQTAHAELAPQGLVLWNWATESDCYAGWVAKAESTPAILAASRALGVEIREGSAPF